MQITTHTKLCGVFGNPVEHSLSPAIHNAAFQKLGLDFVYLAFPVEDISGAIQGVRALGNVCGFSVTIPHKVAVLPYLDEVEATALKIGSVNTIVVRDHKLIGYNTDASGALRALREGGGSLSGKHVLLLGSGGAARAIAFALGTDSDMAGLTMLGVEDDERRRLAKDLEVKAGISVQEDSLREDTLRAAVGKAQVLIHCTPVGMYPKVEETLIPEELFHEDLTVMDIVYNPLETRLLREARSAGCRTIRGLEMFLNQAVAQFELWTNRPAPTDVMKSVLESRFA